MGAFKKSNAILINKDAQAPDQKIPDYILSINSETSLQVSKSICRLSTSSCVILSERSATSSDAGASRFSDGTEFCNSRKCSVSESVSPPQFDTFPQDVHDAAQTFPQRLKFFSIQFKNIAVHHHQRSFATPTDTEHQRAFLPADRNFHFVSTTRALDMHFFHISLIYLFPAR